MKLYFLFDVKFFNNLNCLIYVINMCNRRVKVVGLLRLERFEFFIVFVKFLWDNSICFDVIF